MQQPTPPKPDTSFVCGLCSQTFSDSQIAWRGVLSFCQACASEKPRECLLIMGAGAPKPKSPWLSTAATIACFALVGSIGWKTSKPLPEGEQLLIREFFASNSPIPQPNSPGQSQGGIPSGDAELDAFYNSEPAPAPPKKQAQSLASLLFGAARKRSVEDAGCINLLFVTRAGTDASKGLSSQLFITREAPNDNNAKLVTEVGEDMATSFEEGLRYVRKRPRGWETEFSLRLSFEDKFSSKDGASAGTGFTLAMLGATQRMALDPRVAVTGDLTIDGAVQPVGAVVEKLRGAIEGGCKITLIPERNARSATDLALLDGTSRLWETQIFSIGTIDQAFDLARKDRPESVRAAIARFAALRARLPAIVTPNYLLSPIVQTELQEIVRSAPNHLSASILLSAAHNQLRGALSLNRSVEEILGTSHIFISDIINPQDSTGKSSEGRGITVFPEREYMVCNQTLQRLTPILEPRSIELKSACVAYLGALRAALTYDPPELSARAVGQNWVEAVRYEKVHMAHLKENMDRTRSHFLLALRKLDADGSMVSELRKK